MIHYHPLDLTWKACTIVCWILSKICILSYSLRLQFGVAVVGGKLFVVGGRDGLKTLNTVDYWDMQVSFVCCPYQY